MKNFIVGAQLYSVRNLAQNAEDLKNTLKSLKEMGYNTCQLSGQSREIPDEVVRDILLETGMTPVVTHNSMDDFDNGLDALIRRHRIWNVQYAGLGAMSGEYRTGAEGFRRFAGHANEIAKKLADNGLTFVYHNHAFEFERFDGVLGMDILFDNFCPEAQFELDTYWVQAGGANPVDWIRKVNGRMDVGHFKDMAGCSENGQHHKMVPIGSGNLDWKEIIRACEETGVKYIEIEQDNAADMECPLGQMKSSIDYLKTMGVQF